MAKENILSIFIDESGDFGQFDPKHPMYYVAMVMHEQSNDISSNIAALETLINNWGYSNHAINAFNLIIYCRQIMFHVAFPDFFYLFHN